MLVFGLIAVPLAIKTWLEGEVEKSVEKTLKDEATLRKIAAQSRPSLIFNMKAQIVSDMGALQYVDPKDIRITNPQGEGWPMLIHVGFIRHVSNPPILTALYDSTAIKAERGKGLDWEFTITFMIGTVIPDDKDRLYRLEIVP